MGSDPFFCWAFVAPPLAASSAFTCHTKMVDSWGPIVLSAAAGCALGALAVQYLRAEQPTASTASKKEENLEERSTTSSAGGGAAAYETKKVGWGRLRVVGGGHAVLPVALNTLEGDLGGCCPLPGPCSAMVP